MYDEDSFTIYTIIQTTELPRVSEWKCITCSDYYGIIGRDFQIESPARLHCCQQVLGENCLLAWLDEHDDCPLCQAQVIPWRHLTPDANQNYAEIVASRYDAHKAASQQITGSHSAFCPMHSNRCTSGSTRCPAQVNASPADVRGVTYKYNLRPVVQCGESEGFTTFHVQLRSGRAVRGRVKDEVRHRALPVIRMPIVQNPADIDGRPRYPGEAPLNWDVIFSEWTTLNDDPVQEGGGGVHDAEAEG